MWLLSLVVGFSKCLQLLERSLSRSMLGETLLSLESLHRPYVARFQASPLARTPGGGQFIQGLYPDTQW